MYDSQVAVCVGSKNNIPVVKHTLSEFPIIPLKPSGNYLPTGCIYGFRMILRVSSNYFLERDVQPGVFNGVFFSVQCEFLNII
jgi:hypothetical protein